jgi:hypothetical protein
MDETSDDRIDELLETCRVLGDGFANNMIWRRELADLLIEMKRYRLKPLHCPCCDGDHL